MSKGDKEKRRKIFFYPLILVHYNCYEKKRFISALELLTTLRLRTLYRHLAEKI